MVNINRVRIAWSGFIGSPGVSTFYCLDPLPFRAALWTFMQAFAGSLPSDVTLTMEPEGDVLDPLTGDVVNSYTDPNVYTCPGTGGTGAYAAPVGVVAHWLTGTIINGHRLRGRTYIVPTKGSLFDFTGTVNPTDLAAIRSWCVTLVTSAAANFIVWSRPTAVHAGGYAVVTGSSVPDLAAVLTSRRD